MDKHISDQRVRNLVRRFVVIFGDGVSLGLGSQISQIAAIFLPNAVDHLCKEKLRIKNYGRYMDDLYLIHSDKAYLRYCLWEIKQVCESLGIIVLLLKKYKKGEVSPSATALRASAYPLYGVLPPP